MHCVYIFSQSAGSCFLVTSLPLVTSFEFSWKEDFKAKNAPSPAVDLSLHALIVPLHTEIPDIQRLPRIMIETWWLHTRNRWYYVCLLPESVLHLKPPLLFGKIQKKTSFTKSSFFQSKVNRQMPFKKPSPPPILPGALPEPIPPHCAWVAPRNATKSNCLGKMDILSGSNWGSILFIWARREFYRKASDLFHDVWYFSQDTTNVGINNNIQQQWDCSQQSGIPAHYSTLISSGIADRDLTKLFV